MLHRPGHELKRLTPRNNDRLLFDGIPWVARAQEEHDAFAEALRARDVDVVPGTWVRVPVVVALKDVAKAAGCLRGLLGRATGDAGG